MPGYIAVLSVRITGPNGTDLTLRLKSRAIHVHDGIIGKTDIDKEHDSRHYLPGQLKSRPDEASADGMVLFDQPTALAGKMLTGLQFEIREPTPNKLHCTI